MKLSKILFLPLFFISTCASASRDPWALDAFDRASLAVKMVYVEGAMKQPCALVHDPGGYVHRVCKGDYIGRDFGRVVEISRRRGVRIVETIKGSDGEWVQREALMPVTNAERGRGPTP